MKPFQQYIVLSVWLIVTFLVMTACGVPAPVNDTSGGDAQPASSPPPQSADQQPAQPSGSFECTDKNASHPIALSIAQKYEVAYEQVMGWFCAGYSFENILIALETSKAVEIPPEILLEMLLEKSWEEIWVEIGFVDEQR
jgi:hypothetical protein